MRDPTCSSSTNRPGASTSAPRREIYELIDELARQARPILVVSSDLPEAIGISDRLLVMRAGRIVREFDSRNHTEEDVMFHATGTATPASERACLTRSLTPGRRATIAAAPTAAHSTPFDFANWWDRVGISVVLVALVVP